MVQDQDKANETDEARNYFAEFAPRTGRRRPVGQPGLAPTTAQVKYCTDLFARMGVAAPDFHYLDRMTVSNFIDTLKTGKLPDMSNVHIPQQQSKPITARRKRAAYGALVIQSPESESGQGSLF
jgi:hypothetical protein